MLRTPDAIRTAAVQHTLRAVRCARRDQARARCATRAAPAATLHTAARQRLRARAPQTMCPLLDAAPYLGADPYCSVQPTSLQLPTCLQPLTAYLQLPTSVHDPQPLLLGAAPHSALPQRSPLSGTADDSSLPHLLPGLHTQCCASTRWRRLWSPLFGDFQFVPGVCVSLWGVLLKLDLGG